VAAIFDCALKTENELIAASVRDFIRPLSASFVINVE
jgi:hypothetical protein